MNASRAAVARLKQLADARTLVVMAVLALLGVVIHQAWWSTNPLSAGDWHWLDRGRLLQWFPWPSVWDPTQGLSGQNRFLDAFRFPIYAVSGLIGALGGTWTLAEKLVYFLPFAVLLPIAGWLFAREIMGRTRWALLTPLLLVANSYMLLEGNVHTPLPMAEAVGLLTLVAFMRTMRLRSVAWAIASGLLLSVCAVLDIRAAYLTALLIGTYLVVLTIADRHRHRLLRRVLLAGAAGGVFLLTQAFWWVPLLAYGTVPHLPTPQAPNFNVITLEHGLAGVSAFWTGGRPADLVEAPLNPIFMIIPLLGMVPLLKRRLSPAVVWLALAVLVAAFMAKTDTPPLGGLYDWMYIHVPGWRLFREGSKFLYIVVAGYAVLVPMALQMLVRRAAAVPRRALVLRSTAALGLAGVLAISASSLVTLESGVLDTTTNPTPEPASFSALSRLLSGDSSTTSILWFGSPLVNGADGRSHRFIIASAAHSVENLTGALSETQVNHLDPLQAFCGDPLLPYCYLDAGTFPYLARTTGAGYIVVPGGEDVGVLPPGVTGAWLRTTIASMFGPPTTLGTGVLSLAVWRLPDPAPAVTASPALALVDSGPWSFAQAAPALEALDLPTAYTHTLDAANSPAASPNLKAAVEVTPRNNGGCATSGGPTAVLARSDAGSLQATVGGRDQTLALLSRPTRAPGWGVFGPVDLPAGATALSDAGAQLGPCIAWTPLAGTALGDRSTGASGATISPQGEQLAAAVTGAPSWLELRRAYDPGWRLGASRPTGVADGLFNLYYTGPGSAGARALRNGTSVFQFTTGRWERAGQVVAALSTLGFAGFLVWRRRRRRGAGGQEAHEQEPEVIIEMTSRAAPIVIGAGLALLAVAAAAVTIDWFGAPSRFTRLALSDDPYGLGIGYAAGAIVVLGLGILVRFAETLLARGRRDEHAAAVNPARRAPATVRGTTAAITGVVTLGILLSGCSAAGSDPNAALRAAQASGAASTLVAAASLDDARLRGAAQQPELCIADYTAALTTFSDLVQAYSGRAGCYLAQGRGAPGAVHDLDRAIALSPNVPSLYLSRAVARRAAGDPVGGAADYRVVASLPSATDGSFLQAVDGLISVNHAADARVAVAAGRTRYAGSPLLHVAAADLDTFLGEDGAAHVELLVAAQLPTVEQDVVRVFSSLCHFDLLRHYYRLAITECTRAVSVNGNGAGAYDDRSVAELALGNTTVAISDLGRAIGAFDGNVGPDAQQSGIDGFGVALLLEARGRAYAENGMFASAVADFRAAIDALPPGTPDFAARLKGELQSQPG